MLSLEDERGHLAKADQDIAEGEGRVSAQLLLTEQLRADGHDTSEADRLLLTLQQSLDAWWGHRELILQAIARLEGLPAQ